MHFTTILVVACSLLDQINAAPITASAYVHQTPSSRKASFLFPESLTPSHSSLSIRNEASTALTIKSAALNAGAEAIGTTTPEKRASSNKQPDASKAPVSPPAKLPPPVTAKPPTGNPSKDAGNIAQAGAGEIAKDGGIFASAVGQDVGDAVSNPANAANDAQAIQDQAAFQFADIINDGASLASAAANDAVAAQSGKGGKGAAAPAATPAAKAGSSAGKKGN
jgi:hypothetical protein